MYQIIRIIPFKKLVFSSSDQSFLSVNKLMSCQYVVGCSLANVLLSSPLPSTFRLSFTIFTSCSEPKPVAFLTSTILFSISLGVLLGLLCGLLDLNLRPIIPSSLNLFFYHSLQLTFLLLLIMYAASCLLLS